MKEVPLLLHLNIYLQWCKNLCQSLTHYPFSYHWYHNYLCLFSLVQWPIHLCQQWKNKANFTSTHGISPYLGLIPWLSGAFLICQCLPLLSVLILLLLTKKNQDDELYTLPSQYNLYLCFVIRTRRWTSYRGDRNIYHGVLSAGCTCRRLDSLKIGCRKRFINRRREGSVRGMWRWWRGVAKLSSTYMGRRVTRKWRIYQLSNIWDDP